ncbi:MAG: hypothetical protein WDO14_01200 [Bacteroidota bacterium]
MIQSHPWVSMIIIGVAVRPVVVLLHELGHAIVARLFSNQKIVIFLGSYGNKERSANVSFGSFEIWFTGNPFLWQYGLCVPSFPITRVDHRISYILAGPILPVAVSGVVADAAVFLHFNEYISFFAIVFFAVSVLDLFINLIPYGNAIAFYQNAPVFIDGYLLKLAWLQKKYPTEFFVGINQYSKKEYDDAARNFEKAARRMPGNKQIDKNLKECYRLIALRSNLVQNK